MFRVRRISGKLEWNGIREGIIGILGIIESTIFTLSLSHSHFQNGLLNAIMVMRMRIDDEDDVDGTNGNKNKAQNHCGNKPKFHLNTKMIRDGCGVEEIERKDVIRVWKNSRRMNLSIPILSTQQTKPLTEKRRVFPFKCYTTRERVSDDTIYNVHRRGKRGWENVNLILLSVVFTLLLFQYFPLHPSHHFEAL
jgi:hypothetical protein